MPGKTPLDKALNSRTTFLAFTGIVTAAAAWSIWGSDMFPRQDDPKGDPTTWTEDELRRWMNARNLHPDTRATKAELLDRVQANMRTPRT